MSDLLRRRGNRSAQKVWALVLQTCPSCFHVFHSKKYMEANLCLSFKGRIITGDFGKRQMKRG
jgi:hypothetical protein